MNLIVCPKHSSEVDLCAFEFMLCFIKTVSESVDALEVVYFV
jgi:hypothetical protein